DRPDDETLEVRLAGDWLLAMARPSAQDVTREIEARPTKLVRLLARDVGAWDTGMLTFVHAVLAACRARPIEVDRDGLPTGVKRLLALAEAVPEKQGARRDDVRPPWLARVGTRATSDAEGLVGHLDFLGRLTLVLGRFALRRARYQVRDLW